jgi:hypothetical protein
MNATGSCWTVRGYRGSYPYNGRTDAAVGTVERYVTIPISRPMGTESFPIFSSRQTVEYRRTAGPGCLSEDAMPGEVRAGDGVFRIFFRSTGRVRIGRSACPPDDQECGLTSIPGRDSHVDSFASRGPRIRRFAASGSLFPPGSASIFSLEGVARDVFRSFTKTRW